MSEFVENFIQVLSVLGASYTLSFVIALGLRHGFGYRPNNTVNIFKDSLESEKLLRELRERIK